MKKIKRVLSLFAAVLLLFSNVITVSAAKAYDYDSLNGYLMAEKGSVSYFFRTVCFCLGENYYGLITDSRGFAGDISYCLNSGYELHYCPYSSNEKYPVQLVIDNKYFKMFTLTTDDYIEYMDTKLMYDGNSSSVEIAKFVENRENFSVLYYDDYAESVTKDSIQIGAKKEDGVYEITYAPYGTITGDPVVDINEFLVGMILYDNNSYLCVSMNYIFDTINAAYSDDYTGSEGESDYAASTNSDNDNTDREETKESESNNNILYIVAGVVIGGLILLLVLKAKNGKNADNNGDAGNALPGSGGNFGSGEQLGGTAPVSQAPGDNTMGETVPLEECSQTVALEEFGETVALDEAAENIRNNTFCIVGEGGYFDKIDNLFNDPVIYIGRDINYCTLRFPSGATNIGEIHCALKWDGETLTLIDQNSGAGTFVNGKRLSPLVPQALKHGDKFWLADESNSFIYK